MDVNDYADWAAKNGIHPKVQQALYLVLNGFADKDKLMTTVFGRNLPLKTVLSALKAQTPPVDVSSVEAAMNVPIDADPSAGEDARAKYLDRLRARRVAGHAGSSVRQPVSPIFAPSSTQSGGDDNTFSRSPRMMRPPLGEDVVIDAEPEERKPWLKRIFGDKKNPKNGAPNSKNGKSGKKTAIVIVAIVVFLILLGLAGFYIYSSSNGFGYGGTGYDFSTPTLVDGNGNVVPGANANQNVGTTLTQLCDSGLYTIYNRYPATSYLGTRPFKTPTMTERTGSELTLQLYRVAPVQGLPSVLMVQQDGSVYFMPTDAFPVLADNNTPVCLSMAEAGGFISTSQSLNPEPLTARITSDSPWFPVLVVILLVMFAGAILAVWVGGRMVEFILMTAIILSAIFLTPYVAVQGLGWLYAFGLVACIALGSRGEVEMVRSAMSRSSSKSTVTGELGQIVESVNRGWGLIGGIDWSSAGWWAGLYLALGLLNPSLSPLHVLFGSLMASIYLTLQVLLFFGLESFRRGTKGDWGGYISGLLGLAYFIIFKFVIIVTTMYITALVVGIFILILLVIIGLSAREEINRDRLPDSMFLFGSMVLIALTVVVLFV